MKTKKYIVLILFAFVSLEMYAQVSPHREWTLPLDDASYNSGIKEYVARDKITLKQGFSRNAASGSFVAKLNETMVVDNIPVTESTIPTNVPAGSAIGKINGVFNVSETGSATYNIPIETPPGTLGMQPSLSIDYNSKGGNSIMGSGWNISGLSAITRVNKNYYNDQKQQAIKLTASDAYAIDGQRIFPSSTNANNFVPEQISFGVAGTYETYLSIVALGTTYDHFYYQSTIVAGPLSFEVITKDGKKMIYGGTTDSRQIMDGTSDGPVLTWMLSRVIDLNGNYVDYHYIQENGTIRIDHIDYTGNISGQQPYNHIVFVYETRQDKKFSYLCGYKIENNLLLTQIKIKNENNLVNYYSFDYSYSNNISRLVKVNQSLNGGADLNSTLITWKNGSNVNSSFDLPINLRIGDIKTGDFDGDGKSEFFVTTSTSWKLVDHDMNTIITSGNLDYFDSSFPFDPQFTTVGDFDGDGKDDLVFASKGTTDLTFYFVRLVGNTLCKFLSGQRFTYHSIYVQFYPLDYNGDGTWEILIRESIYLNYTNHKYANAVNGVLSTILYQGYQADEVQKVNFNGDKSILLFIHQDIQNTVTETKLSTSEYNHDVSTYITYPNYLQLNTPRVFSGDFNGDGKSDILTQDVQFNWQIAYSNGKNWVDQTAITFLPVRNNNVNILIADINGDGKDDIIYYYHSNTNALFHDHDDLDYPNTWDWDEHLYIKVYFSNGNGSFTLGINRSEYRFFEHLHSNPTIPNPSYSIENFLFCDINGDGKKDIINNAAGMLKVFQFSNQSIPYLVENIIDGFNNRATITYSTLSDPTCHIHGAYSNQSNNTYVPLCNSMSIVKNVIFTGLYDYSEENYTYEGASYIPNKALLGFTKIVKNETRVGNVTITTTSNFEQKYNSTWLKNSEQKNGATVLEYKEYSNTFSTLNTTNKIYKILPNFIKTTDVNGNLRNVTYDFFDDEGNATQITEKIGNVVTNVIKNTYAKYGTWSVFKNRHTSNVVTTTYSNQSSFVNKTSNTYNSNGNLLTKTEHDGTTKSVITSYSMFNTSGLPEKVTVSGNGTPSVETIITSYSYDIKHRFITYMKNPLNQESFKTFDCWGNVLTEKSVAGLTTSYTYDKSNRLIRTLTPEGFIISSTYAWDKLDNIESLYSVSTTATQKPSLKIWYDDKDREVKRQTDEFSGVVTIDKEYNKIWGKLASESNAYFPGEKFITSYYYNDNAGRLTSSTTLQKTTTYSYPLNQVTITKPNNDVITKTFNAKGDVTNINTLTGQLSKNIIYTYHSSGNPLTINADGYVTSILYDDCGRQEELNDPNAGKTSYIYDAYGQLRNQTNASMLSYAYVFDKLGRLSTQTGDNDGLITYTYYSSGSGINQIESEMHSNGTGKHYQYGTYGRLASVTENINGQVFTTGYHYDSYGNVDKLTYPSGFAVTNVYNQQSFLTDVSTGSTPIWHRVEETNLSKKYNMGADNGTISKQIELKYYYSNIDFTLSTIESKVISSSVNLQKFGYKFDLATGNLQWRKDNFRNIQEDFGYDIDRLTNAKIGSTLLYSTTYKDNGNINSKSDAAGVYNYHPTQVNAVIKLENFNTANFSSDLQHIDYTSFNKASEITEGPVGNATLKMYNISYGTDQQRNMSTYQYQGQPLKTKYYLPSFEQEIVGSFTKNIHYIKATNGVCAVYLQQSDGNNNLYYVLKDHLGSVTGLVNQAGQLEYEYSYNAWGRMRNPTNYTDYNITQTTLIGRGFTGHEHLPEFGLINMNGRMYDPVVGRFLCPDNNVSNPEDLQSFNRYSYCLNNPLKYTDPSGNTEDDGYGESGGGGGGTSGTGYNIGAFGTGNGYRYAATIRGYVGKGFGGGNNRNRSSRIGYSISEGFTLDFISTGYEYYGYNNDGTPIEINGVTGYGWIDWYSVTVQNPIVSDVIDYVRNVETVNTMYNDFRDGTGSETRTFYNDRVANAMRDAHIVNEKREEYYSKFEGKKDLNGSNLPNKSGSFGLVGLLRAGFDPIEQFVGGFDVSIYCNGKELIFDTFNRTSMQSLFYDHGPLWSRSTYPMGGNMYQHYIWKEKLRTRK